LISELFFVGITGTEKVTLLVPDGFNHDFSALSFKREFANGWASSSESSGTYNLESALELGPPDGIYPCGRSISQVFTETGSVTQTLSFVGASTTQNYVRNMGGNRTTTYNYSGGGYTGTMEANSQDYNHTDLTLIPAYGNLICSVSICGRLILSQDTYTTRDFIGPNFTTVEGTFSQTSTPLSFEVIGLEETGNNSFIESAGLLTLVGDFLEKEISAVEITNISEFDVTVVLDLYVVPFNLEAALL